MLQRLLELLLLLLLLLLQNLTAVAISGRRGVIQNRGGRLVLMVRQKLPLRKKFGFRFWLQPDFRRRHVRHDEVVIEHGRRSHELHVRDHGLRGRKKVAGQAVASVSRRKVVSRQTVVTNTSGKVASREAAVISGAEIDPLLLLRRIRDEVVGKDVVPDTDLEPLRRLRRGGGGKEAVGVVELAVVSKQVVSLVRHDVDQVLVRQTVTSNDQIISG